MKKFLSLMTSILIYAASLFISAEALAQATHTITISNYAFTPSTLTINEGDHIVFQLGVGASPIHPTVADNGTDWATFTLLNPGDQSGTFTLTAGTHTYHCANHGVSFNMTGSITVTPAAGTKSSQSAYGLTIAPNPFENEVTLNIDQGHPELTKIRINDLIGNQVAEIDLSNKNLSNYRLDFSHLKPGVYFCNLYSDKGILETRKLFRTK